MDWEVVGYAGHDRNEMALVSLHRPLRNVSPVYVRRCFLNATTIHSNCFYEFFRCFVVENMPIRADDSGGLPPCMDSFVGFGKFPGCS